MRALLVYNSFSGRSKLKNKISYAYQRLNEFLDLDIYNTEGPSSITNYIIKNGKNYELIIAAGGDGTIHEAINGIMKSGTDIVFACIPMGTCNDLAKSLGFSKNIDKSIEIIKKYKTRRMDISKINDSYFIYGLACGDLSSVSYRASHKSKLILGKLSYYLNVLSTILKAKPFKANIKLDGKEYDNDTISLFLATNSRYLAGMRLKSKGHIYLNDNKLSLLIINKVNRIHLALIFTRFLLFGEYKGKRIYYTECNNIEMESSLNSFNTDGERLNTSLIKASVINKGINVIAKEEIINKYFRD